jgi:hypothetical protein
MSEKVKIKNKLLCKICNKYYSSQSSLCNHIKKFHSDNILKSSDNILKSSDNILKSSDNILKNYNCRKCNKIFNNIKTRWSHEKICQINNNNLNQSNYQHLTHILKEENILLKEELLIIKNQMSDIINKFGKIHPKTLQKINKQLINNTTNNNTKNTINNTTINNTVNIKFGYEKLSDILNEKEMIKILNNCKMCVEESIKVVHFNDDRPEFRNILITNLRDNVAYIFDGNRFVAQNKDYILTELFDKHYGNIENHVLNNEFMRKLNDSILCKYLIEFI